METAKKIKFNYNGKLKIMHVTDTHLKHNSKLGGAIWSLEQACDIENPDIVMITGDNVVDCKNPYEVKQLINTLMSVFESRNIPVAVCFGNHDAETGGMTKEELMAHYNTFSCSVSVDEGESLSGCGTYNIPVFSSNGDKVKFNLWVFDSGDYDEKHRYSCVRADQIEWYKEMSKKLKEENGGEVVNSFAFQHIIVAEIYDALKKVTSWQPYAFKHLYNKKDYYMFNPECVNYGTMKEYPCPGFYNFGQFDAMVEMGDVLALFTGHDHTNGFGVRYNGVDIFTSLSNQYGYRVIELDENDTFTYKTRVVHWFDVFTFRFVKENKGKYSYEFAIKGKIQKIISNSYRSIVEKLTGRKVTYPDQ